MPKLWPPDSFRCLNFVGGKCKRGRELSKMFPSKGALINT